MRKKIVCVFAHPDDEAFGPGGSIAKFSLNYDVHLLCATKGEAGAKSQKNIATIREKELLASAKILGIKYVNFLGFKDGCLCNEIYHKIVAKVKEEINTIKPDMLLTFEPRGVSGHIDHITISMVTAYLFEHSSYVEKLLYYCHTENQMSEIRKVLKDYFVYFPPGYKQSEIGETIDISDVWDLKLKAMKKHKSQINDFKRVIRFLTKLPKEEHFLVVNK